ncbi:hypothetical protein FocTR4_00006564, partial [Fusarium oxysporum f. sp. cubense]
QNKNKRLPRTDVERSNSKESYSEPSAYSGLERPSSQCCGIIPRISNNKEHIIKNRGEVRFTLRRHLRPEIILRYTDPGEYLVYMKRFWGNIINGEIRSRVEVRKTALDLRVAGSRGRRDGLITSLYAGEGIQNAQLPGTKPGATALNGLSPPRRRFPSIRPLQRSLRGRD